MSVIKTLIFAPETFNLAETTRAIETAKHCRNHFRCIFMGYSTTYSYLIEEAGFTFHLLSPHVTDAQVELIMKADQMKTIKNPFTFKMVKQRVESEIELISLYKPAAIVIGTTLSLFISARACDVKLVYIKPFAYTRTHLSYGNVKLPGFLSRLSRLMPEKRLLSMYRNMILHMRYIPRSFSKVSAMYNVQYPKYTIDMLDADYNLITNIPEITGVSRLPENDRYVGPIFAKLDTEIPRELTRLNRDKPLIYFAMGSSGGKKLVSAILHILSHLNVTVICPMKKLLGDCVREYQNDPHIHICDLLPAHEISKIVDLSIIHGGEGTVQTACLSGKPFIGIGLQAEQEANIDDCVSFGNAVKLHKNKVNKRHIEQALHSLLNNKSYQEGAAAMEQLLRGKNGAKNSAAFLINKFGT
ncbi:glycosyl transferase [Bacillus vallismortis]|nr:glycosyl transferase [Bacillus vallismortis]